MAPLSASGCLKDASLQTWREAEILMDVCFNPDSLDCGFSHDGMLHEYLPRHNSMASFQCQTYPMIQLSQARITSWHLQRSSVKRATHNLDVGVCRCIPTCKVCSQSNGGLGPDWVEMCIQEVLHGIQPCCPPLLSHFSIVSVSSCFLQHNHCQRSHHHCDSLNQRCGLAGKHMVTPHRPRAARH